MARESADEGNLMITTNADGGALTAGTITRLQSRQAEAQMVFRFQTDSGTNLNEDLDAVEAGIDVVDSSVFSDDDIIQIDDEFMRVDDASLGPNQILVTRGHKWNPAATHSNGADIFIFNEYPTLNVSDLSIDPDMGASEAIVTVSNADQFWNIFLSDLTNHGNTGTLELHFTGFSENITLYTGVADHVEFDSDNMTASIYLVDSLSKFLDQEISPDPAALDLVNGASTNPMDFIWDILVTEGGLDSTASSDNIHIDYTKWNDTKTKLTAQNANIGARMPRFTTYRETIQAILYLHSLRGFITHEGRIGFDYIDNDAVSGDDTWDEGHILRTVDGSPIDGHRVYTDLTGLVNWMQAFHGYDPSTDGYPWAGSKTQSDATSIAEYGQFNLSEANTLVWHDTLASATGGLDWIESIHKDPKVFSQITTWLNGIRSEIGDVIDLTDTDYGFANKLMKIEKILRIDMNNYTVTVLARA